MIETLLGLLAVAEDASELQCTTESADIKERATKVACASLDRALTLIMYEPMPDELEIPREPSHGNLSEEPS